jgi:hypothetical protein
LSRTSQIRDLLYFDFDKAASIWSQFDEGLLERVTVNEDVGTDQVAGTKFGIRQLLRRIWASITSRRSRRFSRERFITTF